MHAEVRFVPKYTPICLELGTWKDLSALTAQQTGRLWVVGRWHYVSGEQERVLC